MDEVVVSVLCLAYNHAPWIRDALEGFVAQRTKFRFEVLVHDDASTDGTAEVIREYQARYPGLIRPVFQTENQYRRGVPVLRTFLAPLVRGRYVALCEGDDYWTDPYKLQKQAEVLDAHPEWDLCAHRALRVQEGKRPVFVAPRLRSGWIPAEDVIVGGGSRFLATASLFVRTSVFLEASPMHEILINDYVLQLQGVRRGGLYYLSDCMSVYRAGVPGSWTEQQRGKRAALRQTTRAMLRVFDTVTRQRYHRAVARRIALYDSDDLVAGRHWAALLSPGQLPATLHQLRRTGARWLRQRLLEAQRFCALVREAATSF